MLSVRESHGSSDSPAATYLVARNQSTTNVTRARLSLVHGHKQRKSTHAQTSHPTTHHNLDPVVGRRDLDNKADAEDDAPQTYRVSSADPVCDGSSNERADESTDGQHADNKTRPDVAEVVFAIVVALAEMPQEVGHR